MTEKKILVTGVSRGLGLEIARLFLQREVQVFGICRQVSAPLETLQGEFPEALRVLTCDLGDLSSIKEHVFGSEFVSKNEVIDGVVNNAAIAYDDLITNFAADPLETMIRVNLTAPMLLCREAIRNMLLHKTPGAFVHLSSVCAHTGYKGLAAYGATKGGLEAFSRALAREWGARGIRSNCIAAGFMETDMSAGLDEESKTRIQRRTALGTLTDPASVAATVAFLLSVESASMTGETIAVDAGAR